MTYDTAIPAAPQAGVSPETANALAWEAVAAGRAAFLVDRPGRVTEPCEPSGPYREDADDFLPSLADEEWRLAQLAADRARFLRLFEERAEFHAHVDASPDSGWRARQFAELARLARATDAADVATMLDRLVVLAEQYA